MVGLGVENLPIERFRLAQLAAPVMGGGAPQPLGEIGLLPWDRLRSGHRGGVAEMHGTHERNATSGRRVGLPNQILG